MIKSTLTWDRNQNLESIRSSNPKTKILIIGGGIHGAALARIAALNGTDCILLEKQDYASGTSSRSSKMAHGGLRYLETFDFQQVFEGIKAREELFNVARHICKPAKFLFPIKKNDWWFRVKLGIGLYLYDLMCTKAERLHGWIKRSKLSFEGLHSARTDLMGCYFFYDGIMNDARLVIETIVHAREMGARCINYVGVTKVEKNTNGTFVVSAKDELTGEEYTIAADLVINCAGPWVPYIGHKESQDLNKRLRYSAGVHLLFNRPWTQPCLFLPMEQKNRYYFVWPHAGGTMVGTTEREVTDLPFEQYPLRSEVDEVMERIAKDLPDAQLTRDTLHYAFAGVRNLALRGNQTGTATLSRKHLWENHAGVLTLLGGKWTTSSWTSFEGYKEACKILGLNDKNAKSLDGIKFPGWAQDSEMSAIRTQLEQHGIPTKTAERIVRRLGSRANYLLEDPKRLELITENLTKGEIELGLQFEQAVTIEDLLRRRTELEYLVGNGLNEIEGVSEMLRGSRSAEAILKDAQLYRARIQRLHKITGHPSE